MGKSNRKKAPPKKRPPKKINMRKAAKARGKAGLFLGDLDDCGEICEVLRSGEDKPISAGLHKGSGGTPETQAQLRYLVAQQYITGNQTLGELSVLPKFKVILSTMENWSRLDRWVDRRRAFREHVQAIVERKMATEQAHLRIETLNRTKEISDKLFEMLMAKGEKDEDILKPKSFETAVSAWVKLVNVSDELREKMVDFLSITMGAKPDSKPEEIKIEKRQPVLPVRPQLTQLEARTAAKSIMKTRREDLRLEEAKKKDIQVANPQVVGIVGGKSG